MSTLQLPLVARPHNNQRLFSDHYLNALLPARADWRLLAAGAGPAMARIGALVDGYRPSGNEAQLERELVRPVLEALGHTFEVQPALATPDGTKRPDYVLYRDDAGRVANKNRVLTEEALGGRAFAVGDAKAWDRPLDVAIRGSTSLTTGAKGGDPFTNKNPSYQIAFYMQHSGLEWGILTNGRRWRLYHRDTAHKLDRFYEVDLPALLGSGDPARFLYFYALFRRAAFEPGPLGVGAILGASADYARGVGDTLKAQVYEALRHLAQGFLDYQQNGLGTDPATLREIYDNALIALYRLLFVLYAEARELLPVGESAMYRDAYSLHAIKGDVARGLAARRALLPTSATLWPRLRELFAIINEGSPPLAVATFNGGLFDPARHSFLERYAVGDAHLRAAIDKLARVGGQFVDYRDLAERHLGTIYEGLLEYHLEALPEGTRPGAEGGWTVALLNDKGERKATGSYYTPDYIVKYIVERTVGPVLREAVARAGEGDAAKVAAVLGVNVLDPAMGSGHFLVEATEYIARFLVDLAVAPDADTGGEAGGDLAYWKRRVAQSCIYGVDLNPLAVDLAQLSLWLSTVAKDRPLSFLDHHLRAGDALVGARLADVQAGGDGVGAGAGAKQGARGSRRAQRAAAAGQLSMLDDDAFRRSLSTAVDYMWLIEGSAGETIAEVKEQERVYGELRASLNGKYGRLADLVTATHFGLGVDPALWRPLADYATGRTIAAPARLREWLAAADAIARRRRFFHWELEFPEVFFDRHGQPLGERAGFDAVVGNPPYDVLAEKERNEDLAYFMSYIDFDEALQPARGQKIDLFRLFVAKSMFLAHAEANVGLIVPMSLLADQQTMALRKHLLTHHNFLSIDAFPQKDDSSRRVFPEAKLPTCVVIAKSTPQQKGPFAVVAHPGRYFNEVSGSYTCQESDLIAFDQSSLAIPLLNSTAALSLAKKLASGDRFGVMGDLFQSYQGEINETTMARILSMGSSIGPKVLRGSNVQRYRFETEAKQGVDKYIDVQAYERQIGGTRAAHTKMPRIGYQRNSALDSSRRLIFALLPSPSYCFDSISYIPIADERRAYALLALLNAQLLEWCFRLTSSNNHVSTREVARLPVVRFTFTTPADERERLRAKGQTLYAQFCDKEDYACVLGFVEHQLPRLPDGTPDTVNEHSDAVHDLLAYLAEQMIALNKQRHAAVEDFVLDLEGMLSEGELQRIGRLWTPPGVPKAGGKDFEKKQAIYARVRAEAEQQLGPLAGRRLELRDDIGAIGEAHWKWLLKGRLKKIENMADLVRVYRKHQPGIAALDRRIALTDRLIDRIVYALYGLTEEEIAVVEGRTEQG